MALIYTYSIIIFISLLILAFIKFASNKGRKRFLSHFMSSKTLEELKKLNVNATVKNAPERFYEKKIRQLFLLISVGAVFALIYELSTLDVKEIDGNRIERSGYEGQGKTISVWINSLTTGDREKLQLTVSNTKYTQEELESLSIELDSMIRVIILGNNESEANVVNNLNCVDSIEGYPFNISYRSSMPLIINNKGIIQKEKLRDYENSELGIPVKFTVMLKRDEYKKEIIQNIVVFPKNEKLSLKEAAIDEIEKYEEETRTEKYMFLPTNILGTPVSYEESKSYKSLVIILLTFAAAIVIYRKEDSDLSDTIKRREEIAINDYPRLLNKFVLFYSVGMPTKGIFLKVCTDYENNRKRGMKSDYVYEEMLRTRRRLEEGIGEVSAYEEYGSRMRLPQYRRLVNIMQQAVTKGKQDIEMMLEDEMEKAYTDRKNRARRLAEEAGTKLLGPMFIMLFVVLIIIMIPAFISFKM